MEEQTQSNTWLTPSVFDTTKPPKLVTSLELESCCRSSKWCADGRAILTTNEDRNVKIWMLEDDSTQSTPTITSSNVRSFRQASPIYDIAWYPFSTPTQPATYCFLASVRGAPVQLLDAGDGRVRASYRIIDHREQFVCPHSLAFNLTGQKFYSGFLDAIEVFDLGTPGEGTRLLTIPTKRSKDGLRGIISALSFCPDFSGLYAAGTFDSSIGMLSEDTGAEVLMYLNGVSGPISHLQFHPTNPRLLFATCRNRRDILTWDIRNTSQLYSSLSLGPSSNQRRRFDINSAGSHLVVGDGNGNIHFYDVSTMQTELPVLSFEGHKDAVSNAVFHPIQSKLLTVSGSYRFHSLTRDISAPETGDSSTDGSVSDDDEGPDLPQKAGTLKMGRTRPGMLDSSMKLWISEPT